MGLQENLQNIQTNLLSAKTAIAQSITAKGVECSADEALSTYASKIDSISGGGTGSTGEKFVVPNGLKFAYSSSFDPTMFDVSQVRDMEMLFYNCTYLESLDLSEWDVSNVRNMSYMFNNCRFLTNINVSTWDVSNVTNMSYMFRDCSGLTNINVSNWNVSSVTNMRYMFDDCSKLTTIDLSNFKENNINYMEYMFSSCRGLTSIDLSNFNTSNVTDMGTMFSNCTSLTNLQLNDLGHNEGCTSLDLTTCYALTKDSILYLFNNAFDRATAGYTKAFTIRLNATTKALLSEDEIAIATNKGFTVA